jgi:hypothetical protein
MHDARRVLRGGPDGEGAEWLRPVRILCTTSANSLLTEGCLEVQLIERFAALAFLQADRDDHIEAAEARSTCRRNGVQIGTIDAVLIQLCLRHDLVLLSTYNDFRSASRHVKFRLWGGAA